MKKYVIEKEVEQKQTIWEAVAISICRRFAVQISLFRFLTQIKIIKFKKIKDQKHQRLFVREPRSDIKSDKDLI